MFNKEPKVKKVVFRRVWLCVVIAVLAIAVMGGGCGSDDSELAADNQEIANEEAASEPVVEIDYIEPGMYKIGADLNAGEYVIFGSGYLEVTKDSTGSFDSIIANDNYENITYITVKDGQYLSFRDGEAYPVSEAPFIDLSSFDFAPAGKYLIGRDIPAGEYKVVADGDLAYIEVSKDSLGGLDSILSNDNFEGEKYITVTDGQYLRISRCELKL